MYGCNYGDVTFRPTRATGNEVAIHRSWSMIVLWRCWTLVYSNMTFGLFCSNKSALCWSFLICQHDLCSDHQLIGFCWRKFIYILVIPTGHFSFNGIVVLQFDHPLRTANNRILAKACVTRTNSPTLQNDQYLKHRTWIVVIGWGCDEEEEEEKVGGFGGGREGVCGWLGVRDLRLSWHNHKWAQHAS